MVLSPQDIHNKEFSVKMRGYNIDEVNDYLDRIIKDYQLTLEDNETLKKKLNSVDEKLKQYDGMKDSLNQSIIVAQNAADNLRSEAKKESKTISEESQKKANKILDDATTKSNNIMKDASERAKSLLTVNDDLHKSTSEFKQKIRTLLQSQLDLLENNKWDQVINSSDDNYDNVLKKVNELDNYKQDSVKSTGKDELNDKKVTVFYPDGSFNIFE
ncbi:DivIVA domain-containing protein [Apilactobacillus apisilvae]|uniref:DivIVA domain-containing protein n=1 Tax=Apilactobacillus apisilvae TaxID=2923364 RepID=A0ABY4PJP0_9LACO|nr:DivIVA domain-containing protein [Apilactobacillus apisilvae]UQS85542.1 DivIVA domain-containing protein [Apilactobacillus apisilvae]